MWAKKMKKKLNSTDPKKLMGSIVYHTWAITKNKNIMVRLIP